MKYTNIRVLALNGEALSRRPLSFHQFVGGLDAQQDRGVKSFFLLSSSVHLVYMSFMVGLILVIMRDTCEFYAIDEEYLAMPHLPHF